MHIAARITLTALLLGSTTLVTGPVEACGEVMYRMGSALRYQAFISRHPAQILLYGESAEAQANTMDREAFRQKLHAAGHRTFVAKNAEELAQLIAERPYDIVIAGANDLALVRRMLQSTQHAPSLIPVLKHDDDSLRNQYPMALVADSGVQRALKTIERTMQARGT
ncbi:MAG TPA: hypothetical protein VFN29_03540 [Chiayiivirga sp.]|nr:hypothetical protein [Chiayiivirga sp.]